MTILKDAAVAEFKIPIWSVIATILIGLFHIGMTYQQFDTLKGQNSTLVADSRAMLAVINEQSAKVRALEERQLAASNQSLSLERRIITLEDFIIRKGIQSPAFK